MNKAGSKLQSFGITNSATLDEIRNDETFQFLSAFIKENGIERETKEFNGFSRKNHDGDKNSEDSATESKRILIGSDPNFREKYPFLKDSITSGAIESIQLNELRTLKQALNNQICLYVFEKFVAQISNLQKGEIPCIKKGENESIEIYPITPKEFVKLEESAKNVGVIAELHDMPPKLLKLWTSRKARILRIIQPVDAKARIIGHFLILFGKVINVFFDHKIDEIFMKKTGEDIQDVVELYLFLENFIVYHTASFSEDECFTSFTQYIALNNNIYYLRRFLEEQAVENRKIPTISQIEVFLSKQHKYQIKNSHNIKDTHMHNTEQTIFDVKKGVFVAMKEGTWDSPSKELDKLGGCPFAKTRLKSCDNSKPENAFMRMFQIFDNYSLMIIRELNKRGFK